MRRGEINSLRPRARRSGNSTPSRGRKASRVFAPAPALKRGADELMARIEWALRNDRPGLRAARNVYRKCCTDLYRFLKKHFEGQP